MKIFKKKMPRRDFLKSAALFGVGVTLAACNNNAEPITPEEPQPGTDPVSTDPTAVLDPTAVPVEAIEPQVYTFAEAGDFTGFNPWGMYAANDLMHNLGFSRLIYKTSDGVIHKDIAESWEMAEDGLSMTMKIKEDVSWHDGKPFVAGDVVDMYQLAFDDDYKDMDPIPKIAGLLSVISDLEAIDDFNLLFSFDEPVPFIFDILDYWYMVMVKDPTDAMFTRELPVGTGPYYLAEWEPTEFTRWERFEDYYDTPGMSDTVVIRRLAQAETLLPVLQSGQVDSAGRIAFSDVDLVTDDPNLYPHYMEGSGFLVNTIVATNVAPLDNKLVRQALSYACDRETISREIYYGVTAPCSSPFFDPASIAYRADLNNAYSFDLDQARDLLDEAGVNDINITFVTSAHMPVWGMYALIWQSDLAKIGVNLEIVEFESAKFYEVARLPDLDGYHLCAWGTGRAKRDPAIFYNTQPQYWGGGPDSTRQNPVGWVNEEYDEMVTQAEVELDPDVRAQLYQRCNEIVVDELPMIQISNNVNVSAHHNYVKDVEADLLGIYRFNKVWMDKS